MKFCLGCVRNRVRVYTQTTLFLFFSPLKTGEACSVWSYIWKIHSTEYVSLTTTALWVWSNWKRKLDSFCSVLLCVYTQFQKLYHIYNLFGKEFQDFSLFYFIFRSRDERKFCFAYYVLRFLYMAHIRS